MTFTSGRSLSLSVLFAVGLLAQPLAAQENALPAPEQPAEPPPPSAPVEPPAATTAPSAPETAEPAAIPEASALPAPATVGSLEVVTDVPGAEVMIDGVRMGTTPVRIDALAVGPHSVQVSREGGAPVTREISVQEGVTVRVDLQVGGGPARPGAASLGNQTPPPSEPVATKPSGPSIPGKEFFSTFLEQPWAWLAAAVCGASLLVAAILWTTRSPADVMLVGPYIKNLPNEKGYVWRGIQITALVVAVASGLLALGLFVWPTLPFAKFVALPSLTKLFGGNKDDKQKPAQPQQKPAG